MSPSRSRKFRSIGIAAAIAVGASLGVLAPAAMAAPPNDAFANRASLGDELPVQVTESNVGATRETGEHISEYGKGHSIWWEWEAPITGWITVSVCGSAMHSVVNVFEGTELSHLTSLTERRGNGDEGPQCWATQTTYTFEATAGHDYVIGADGNAFYVPPPPPAEPVIPTGEGEIKLSIEATPPPPNDAFADAIRLGESFHPGNQSPFEAPNEDEYFWEQTPGYNWGATKQSGEPPHAGDPGGASVWYVWTPPRSGEAWISLQGAGGPKLLALYTGSTLTELTPVASSSPGSIPSLRTAVTAGTEYRIAVDGSATEKPLEPQWDPFMGSFNVSIQLKAPGITCGCVREPPPPPPLPQGNPIRYPTIKLVGHQVDPTARSATFRFSSPTAGAAFICRVDGKAYRACSSPFKVKGLKPGKHVFRVLATFGGTTSTSPGVIHFTVPTRHRRHHQAG